MNEIVFPPLLTVRIWDDPFVDRVGFPVRDPYLELVWLPVVGPSVAWATRCLGAWATAAGSDGVEVPLVELAEALGLSRNSLSRNAPLQRTLARMVRFGLAEWPDSILRVRAVVPPVAQRHLARLSPRVREAHDRLVARRSV